MATRAMRFASTVVVAGALTAILAGCVPVQSALPSPSASESPRPSPTRTALPDPILRPNASAAANKQFFDFVNSALHAQLGISDGRSIIDNLVTAGFIKANMEVTPDKTALNLTADSIVFSVQINGQCLVGQFTNSAYTSILAPALGTGRCLVGVTRPIDW